MYSFGNTVIYATSTDSKSFQVEKAFLEVNTYFMPMSTDDAVFALFSVGARAWWFCGASALIRMHSTEMQRPSRHTEIKSVDIQLQLSQLPWFAKSFSQPLKDERASIERLPPSRCNQFRSGRKKLSSGFDECPGALFSLLKIAGKRNLYCRWAFVKAAPLPNLLGDWASLFFYNRLPWKRKSFGVTKCCFVNKHLLPIQHFFQVPSQFAVGKRARRRQPMNIFHIQSLSGVCHGQTCRAVINNRASPRTQGCDGRSITESQFNESVGRKRTCERGASGSDNDSPRGERACVCSRSRRS